MMTDRAEIAELIKQINWHFHGEYTTKFLGKVSYHFQQGRVISDMEIRMLKKLILKQNE